MYTYICVHLHVNVYKHDKVKQGQCVRVVQEKD
jgi:hypothetical protein